MSSTAVSKRLISSEEYHKMGETGMLKPDEKVELINGEIYNMCPIGSKHLSTVNQLIEIFVTAYIHQFIVSVQNPIHIDQWTEPLPDITILKYKKDRYNMAIPEPADVLAVIEVADTSYNFDKKVKLPLYASSGIPVYWNVNLAKKVVEVYSNPMGDQYDVETIYHPGDGILLLEKEFEVSEILIL